MNIIEKTQLFSTEKFQKTIKYWKDIIIEEYSAVSIFPNSANKKSKKIKSYSFNLTIKQYNMLCMICKNNISMFTYLFTIYSLLVYKIKGVKKFLFASPQLKKTNESYNKLLGIPVNFNSGETFRELLLFNKDSIGNTYKNNIYPLHEIDDLAQGFNDSSLVKNIVLFSELHCEKYIKEIEEFTEHEMSFRFVKVHDTIQCELRYNSAKYDEFAIQQICKMFSEILSQTLNNIDINIKDINSVEEKKIPEFYIDKSKLKNIVTIFEEQVELYPNKTSVVCPTDMSNIYDKYNITQKSVSADTTSIIYNRYSYKELNEKANQLAHQLSKIGVKKNSIVALILNPSIEMMVSILAVLKAGGAFLPIDPDFPVNRINFMLSDSKSKVLITQDYLSNQFDFTEEIIDIDNIDLSDEPDTNLCKNISQEHLVYMIYTSGTTGQPKGVMLKHENISNYTKWFCDCYEINEKDKTALLSSYAFDLGYTSLFTSIQRGAEIHLIPKDIYTSMSLFINYLKSEELTYLKLTPSLFSVLVDNEAFSSLKLSSLKNVILGGEKIQIKDVKAAYKLCKGLLITNHYGPTEATIGCIAYQMDRSEIDKLNEETTNNSIIGYPIRNTHVQILNHENQILPEGLPGELCIMGSGLAKGYLNQDKLTNERFILDKKNSSEKIYKTGDLGRKLADGKIEFLGRIDNQLKINGYRVELNEVENSLNKLNFIDQSVVVPKSDKDQNTLLYAYYKSKLNSVSGANNNNRKLSSLSNDLKISNKSENNNYLTERLIKNKSLRQNEIILSKEEVDQITSEIGHEILSKYNDKYSLSFNEKVRYKRQLLLKDWGIHGQEKLKSTKVFVAGAGGGASPTVIQLALAGFGTIVICDFDTVELSNLNRQVLHNESRIGMNKALSAQQSIREINPNVQVVPITEKLTKDNVFEMVGDCDMIFDMFDGQQDKFILSECAIVKGIPHFISAMTDLNSYACVFHSPHTPCFHCMFDREKLDILIGGMKGNVEDYEKVPLAVVATSLFQSSSIVVNEAIKYVLDPANVAYNKYFYINQRGDNDLSDSPSYQSMIFAYSDHFRKICKEQGFDWEKGGWRGKFMEELEITQNPDCKMCSTQDHPYEFSINTKSHNKQSTKYPFNEQTMNSGCIAIILDNVKDIALCLLSSLKINLPIILLDKDDDQKNLLKELNDSNTRVLLTKSENLKLSEDLVNDLNRNIAIVNIDDINTNSKNKNVNIELNTSLAAYYKNNNNEEITISERREELRDVISFLHNYRKHCTEQLDVYLDSIGMQKSEKLLLLLYNKLLKNGSVFDVSDLETLSKSVDSRIKDELLKELPHYMIPSHFIELQNFPITPNGKIDLKALPSIEFKSIDDYVAPSNETEKKLIEIWSDVLNIPKESISVKANFFTLGGHSLRATVLISKISKEFNVEISLENIFELSTISEQAMVIFNLNEQDKVVKEFEI